MPKQVTLKIDGYEMTVPEGTLVVNAAKKVGINIPVFCYHPKLNPVGMCRMCMVEIGRPMIDRASNQPQREADGSLKIQFGPKLETACTTPVSDGMVVMTETDKVKAGRREILEFLLTSHPLDCPICDKGGECPLQNLTLRHGPGVSRFVFNEKNHLAKRVSLGELIVLDRERCIQCGRCVRFQNEVVGEPVIGFFQRGRNLEIITNSEPGFDSVFSGNTTDICPVGALTTSDFRFGARPWEMNSAASICTLCPVGCNITFNVRNEAASGGRTVIKRVMPRQNEAVNEIWICDKGRFGYTFTESEKRLTQPLVRRNGKLETATWEEAYQVVGKNLESLTCGGSVILVGGVLANEDLFTLKKLAEAKGGEAVLFSEMAGGDLVAQVGLGGGSNLGALGKGTCILVVASDLYEEAPIFWLRVKQAAQRGANLIVATTHATKLDRYAKHVIRVDPGQEAALVSSFIKGRKCAHPDAADAFNQAENAIIFYGSDSLGLEGSQKLATACADLLMRSGHAGHVNNGLIPVWQTGNEQGAWDVGFSPRNNLEAQLAITPFLLIAGADPVGRQTEYAAAIKKAKFIVVQELFLTATAELADVVLPAQAFTEREGSYTSAERRVQRFYPAVPAIPGPRSDAMITADLAKLAGLSLAKDAAQIFSNLSEQIPDYNGLSYQKLAEVTEQSPIVGRKDLYYGGTTYDNQQGLGIKLAPTAQRGADVKLAENDDYELPKAKAGELLILPVQKLYDGGVRMKTSRLLELRRASAILEINPKTAGKFKLEDGQQASLIFGEKKYSVKIRVVGGLPEKAAFLPRSAGIPLEGPAVGRLEE